MKSKEQICQIDFDQVKDNGCVEYMDEGMAFHTDIRELVDKFPKENGSMQVNMAVLVACASGKFQAELNAVTYTIRQNEILVCLPNTIVDNCMLSPDFDGVVLCLSQRGISEQISENEILDKVFHFTESPIVRLSDESFGMFKLYGSVFMEKIKMKHTPFYREVVASIVRAALYELMANVEKESVCYVAGMTRQRDVLFKKFVEMLSTLRVKPRSVSWYAAQLCVTPKYLSTVCKQVSGKTAFEWINEYVLVDIRYWLKNTNKTVKEIAGILEFPSISFFGKYCRTHLGLSPTELRKQLRELGTEGKDPVENFFERKMT